jgi:hypothetical protein
MGHLLVGPLPKTRKWQEVVTLIASEADVPEVASSVLEASHKAFDNISNDPGLNLAFWLLLQLPLAAHEAHFSEALKAHGINVSETPGIFEIITAFRTAIENKLRADQSLTDIGEMALLSASESLASAILEKTESLFGRTPADVRHAFASLSKSREFAGFSRIFFSKFVNRYLSYFLSRELSNQVGVDGRFENIAEYGEFSYELDRHCWEITKIIEGFSGGWYAKAQAEGLNKIKASGFLAHAFTKIQGALEKGDDNG